MRLYKTKTIARNCNDTLEKMSNTFDYCNCKKGERGWGVGNYGSHVCFNCSKPINPNQDKIKFKGTVLPNPKLPITRR